ncbi:condensation domain-containing protein, partial [Aquimarina litoralis]|uniref:condensation domain-containing protein n=1 Tax=Aquimarina litoralis TaxID=584605 RepID=UPI0031DC429D
EKFIDHPFKEGERLYRSGDLARWLSDGSIAFMGRKDDQVKIRGHRIELGEIEEVLLSRSWITQAVVVVQDFDGDKSLVAYVVSEGDLDKKALRSGLSKELPDYMVPGYYVSMDSLPLTSNGKVDRRSLPEVLESDMIKEELIAPRNVLEKKLVEIWKEILGIDRIGITNDFFELGGHSLKATRLITEYYEEFNVKLSIKDIFSYSTIQSHSNLLKSAKKTEFVTIQKVEKAESYPLSDTQRRLWIASQYSKGSEAYNMPSYFVLDNQYDINTFKAAIYSTIERHEILRTIFREDASGEVRQWVLPVEKIAVDIDYKDYRKDNNIDQKIELDITEDMYKPFDLENGPLIRMSLLQTSDDTYVFYYNMHHIISDGWSMEILANDVLAYYYAIKKEQKANLPELKIQFKDYASWLTKFKKENFEDHKSYWLKKFKGEIPKLTLSISKQRPMVKTYNGGICRGEIDENTFNKLLRKIEESNTSIYMHLLAMVNILLYRYSYSKDLIIGSPISGRIHPYLKNQIGCYVNTVAQRFFINENEDYSSFLDTVKESVLETQDYQMYPFDLLIEDLKVNKDLSRNPLFDIMLVMNQNLKDVEENENNTQSLQVSSVDSSKSKFDLTFYFNIHQKKANCNIVYNKDLFEGEEIEKLLLDFLSITELVTKDDSLLIKDYCNSIIDEVEKQEQVFFFDEVNAAISEDF